MENINNFATFLLSGILLNITPGNDTIFILTKSMSQGKKAGIMSVLGISTGTVIHTILAALGLSVIISKSLLVFNLLKFAGAAYLLYLGYQLLISKENIISDSKTELTTPNFRKIYLDGVLTNVLNPKVALFFISFLPQFIDPNKHNSVFSFLILGFTFTLTGTIWCLILAIFSAKIFRSLKNNGKIAQYINQFCGVVMISLGLKVAFTSR